MNRRPVVHPRPAPESLSTEVNTATPSNSSVGGVDATRVSRLSHHEKDGAQKTWHVDEPSELPAPVIRANMISFRRSYQGRVKVTFFEQE